MADDSDGRVAVYIDFDNIVISRYNQLHGRGAFQADRVRQTDPSDPAADPDVAARIRAATSGSAAGSDGSVCRTRSSWKAPRPCSWL